MTEPLDLGCFSISLSASDLQKSLDFYAALGFRELGGGDDWRIIGNGPTKIGLFQGHFEGNMLTFNPGLAQDIDEQAETMAEGGMPEPVEGFTDVRVIEQRLRDAGVEIGRGTETDEGPEHIMVTDPDGNPILIDQFF